MLSTAVSAVHGESLGHLGLVSGLRNIGQRGMGGDKALRPSPDLLCDRTHNTPRQFLDTVMFFFLFQILFPVKINTHSHSGRNNGSRALGTTASSGVSCTRAWRMLPMQAVMTSPSLGRPGTLCVQRLT